MTKNLDLDPDPDPDPGEAGGGWGLWLQGSQRKAQPVRVGWGPG